MSWRRIRTLVRREILATFRDPFTITILVLVPLMSLLLFGFILSTEVKHLGLGVFDAADSTASRRLLAELESRQSFRIHRFDQRAELDDALIAGDVSVAVVIPPAFDRDLGEARGGHASAEIQVIYDGGEAVLAGNAEGFLESIVAAATPELAPRSGAPPSRRIDVNTRALFNPTFDGAPFMVAGVYGWVLTFVAILLTAVTIVNERLNGTFEQLQVTPATSVEILLGKMLPFASVFIVDVVLMVLIAGFVIGVWPQGNVVLFVVVSAFYLLLSLAFGLLISATSHSAAEAVQKTILFSFPLVMLSGFVYPIRSLPLVIRWISELFPATHYIRLSRAIYIRGAGFGEIFSEIAILTLMGVVLLFAARRAIEVRQ